MIKKSRCQAFLAVYFIGKLFIPVRTLQKLNYYRRYAIRLLRKGMTFRAVAAQTHASLSSVVRWHQAYQKQGRGGLRGRNAHQVALQG